MPMPMPMPMPMRRQVADGQAGGASPTCGHASHRPGCPGVGRAAVWTPGWSRPRVLQGEPHLVRQRADLASQPRASLGAAPPRRLDAASHRATAVAPAPAASTPWLSRRCWQRGAWRGGHCCRRRRRRRPAAPPRRAPTYAATQIPRALRHMARLAAASAPRRPAASTRPLCGAPRAAPMRALASSANAGRDQDALAEFDRSYYNEGAPLIRRGGAGIWGAMGHWRRARPAPGPMARARRTAHSISHSALTLVTTPTTR